MFAGSAKDSGQAQQQDHQGVDSAATGSSATGSTTVVVFTF
ncbi:hypothetical protein [Hahella ganghwensis]|nr:hypothetical protein [Hahella ganghwensis]